MIQPPARQYGFVGATSGYIRIGEEYPSAT
jgi:hypothetical protein